MAQEVLTSLKEHPDAWTRVDTILEYSSNQQTKYYALQILENVIKTRWKVLPRPQCEGISFSFNYIINKRKYFTKVINLHLIPLCSMSAHKLATMHIFLRKSDRNDSKFIVFSSVCNTHHISGSAVAQW